MSNPNFIVHDSEAESDDAIPDEPPQGWQLQPAAEAPFLSESTNPASTDEIQRGGIDKAHAALLSTGAVAPQTPVDPHSERTKAKRRQTTDGRLEKDIYAFNASEEDEDARPNKRKRQLPAEKKNKTTFNRDDYEAVSDYDDGKKKPSSKKKPAKRAKSTGGMSIIDLNESEDDWRPSLAKTPTSGRKSTRNNTHEVDLLPPLPKPKRKPKESPRITATSTTGLEFDGDLTLNFNRSTEFQVAGTEGPAPPTPHNFMVDLSKDHLVLPEERRAEYDPVPVLYSSTELPENPPGNGAYGTPDLLSTIPDPPYDPPLLSTIPDPPYDPSLLSTIPDPPYDPSLRPSQIGFQHLDPPHAAPLAAVSAPSDSTLSSLQNSPPQDKPPTKKAKNDKKRAATDQNLDFTADNGFGVFPIASEWRAAKGKARQGMSQAAPRRKTMNDLDPESGDDDTWAGEVKNTKKRKPVAKKRKSAVVEEGGGVEVQKQKAKAKRSKSKPIETVTISDSEDELAVHPAVRRSVTVQVSGTSSPKDAAAIMVGTKTDVTTNPGEEFSGSIAVTNSLPSVEPSEDQLVPKPKKVHKWQMLKKQAVTGSNESGSPLSSISVMNMNDAPLPPPSSPPVPVPIEPKEDPEPKKKLPAQRRKSRKEDSDEEGWDGDLEPKKNQKKETKPKAPRVTKKAAAAAREEKARLSNEMVKDSDDDGENVQDLPPVEPVKAPTKKEPKISRAAAAKAKREKERIEAEVEETADEEDGEKKEEATPPPLPPQQPPKLKTQPETPSKKPAEKGKSKTLHSPINKGPVKFRVGLSRRAHIEPLLKIIRK
ncbi:uncharacterized protein H6S33_004584 [Morchella sextelata]|uniref:uncharacterized protein n=1 Tax=Morchella sextelata TaxID=1174677 RepID=UPI001D0545E0|nr:uncharacterized protein H6S33_004584 [Morchella sextelata]KAH0605362.1 hypothetical protein H6S33_004584 [Morchella sextelata]